MKWGGSWGTSDGQNIFFCATKGKIFRSSDGGASFTIAAEGETSLLINILGFSDNEIYAAGDGSGIRCNGGEWTSMALNNPYGIPKSSFIFYGLARGNIPEAPLLMLAADLGFDYTLDYGLWGTADGGENLISVDPWPYIYKYVFPIPICAFTFKDLWSLSTETIAIAAGREELLAESGIIYRSHYAPIATPEPDIISIPSAYMINKVWGSVDDSILVAGGYFNYGLTQQGRIYRSTDKGFTWTKVAEPETSVTGLWGLPDASEIYAASQGNRLMKSTDGGLTWSNVDIGESTGIGTFYDIWGRSPNDIFLGGRFIYHFDGSSWEKMVMYSENSGTSDVFNCLSLWETLMGR